jgi:uncharacterized membrane protein
VSEDNLIMLSGYLVLGVAVAILSARSKYKWKTLLGHMSLLLLYSAPLLYGLFALSKEGDALVWWFYLLLAIGAHFLVITLLVVRNTIARPRVT